MNSRWLYWRVHGRKPARRSPRRTSGRGPARCAKFRAWIRTQACVCCGSTFEVEAAHTGSDGGMRQKASDFSCIPLCSDCHTAAPYSYHCDREACEARIYARTGHTIPGLVIEFNREWRNAVAEAA